MRRSSSSHYIKLTAGCIYIGRFSADEIPFLLLMKKRVWPLYYKLYRYLICIFNEVVVFDLLLYQQSIFLKYIFYLIEKRKKLT